MTRYLALALILAAVLPAGAQNTIPLFHAGTIRALILSGRNNHDWRATTPCLRDLLTESGRFDVRVNEEPAGMTADTLAAYDVVILDYNGPRWGAASEAALDSFLKAGRGLVVVHGASWAFNGLPVLGDRHVRTSIVEPPWAEYRKIIGGVWTEEPPATGHAPRHRFSVKIVDKDHPITAASGEALEADDELYHYMRMETNVHIIATAYDDPANKSERGAAGTGKDEPVLWTVQYGRGRVFHTTLGHDVKAMRMPGFVQTFTRGAEWAATGSVR